MISQKSEDFIQRTLARLDDDKEYMKFLNEVMGMSWRFYTDTPRHVLKALMEKKMREGAEEHGEVKTDPTACLYEIRMEDLDKLCWTAMYLEAKEGR